MTLTKSNLICSVCDQLNLSTSKSANVVETLLETIKKTLEDGEDVLISGFGKFCVKEKTERRGRNPATGENFPLEARRVVTFRCSPGFKDKINRIR